MEAPSDDPLPPDDLRCKRTDGRDWRCKRHVADGKFFCLSHLYRTQKHTLPSSTPTPSNPNPEPQPKSKPTLRIRVRVKPEPSDEFDFNPPPENPVPPPPQPGPKPVSVLVPDHLRCHRNDGRSWRCKKQALEGQTLCEVHFKRAKTQNQRRPTVPKKKKEVQGPGPSPSPQLAEVPENLRCARNNGKDWRCKKPVVEGQFRCEIHLKKQLTCKTRRAEKGNVGGGDTVATIPDAELPPQGSSLLPPTDNLRCTRNDGRDWRCKKRAMEGQSLCEAHFKKIKIKDLVGCVEKKMKISTKKKKTENADGVGGVSDSAKMVIKMENEEVIDNVVQGAVVALAATGEGVIRSEKTKRKPVVRSEKAKKNPVMALVAAEVDDELRCKRTDGRGWRCKRRILEGKTLCELHFEQGRLRQLKITVPEELKIQRGEGIEKVEKRLKRKRDLQMLENNSDKGMKRMRADLIRVFLRREIIESKKKSKKRVEDSGEVRKDLPFGSMAIPPAPPSQILGNVESLGIKIGAQCSNSLVTRRFRSKNIEPPPIGPVKIVPFPGKAGKVKSNGRRKCHWCKNSDNLSLSKCSSCRERYFCSICIKERSTDPKEVKLRCPVCRGTCDCKLCCNATQIKATSSKDILVEKFKGTKFQQLYYLINFLLPVLEQINQDQGVEVEREAKFKGQNPSDVEVRQADVGCRDQCCCNNCKCPIVDFHRSCPNCSYNLCLSCCREYSQGGYLGDTYPNGTRTLALCQEKSLEMSVDLASSMSLQISCPPMELGGCDNSLLDLRCIFPLNWTKELEISAKETISELDCQQIAEDSVHCSLCTSIIRAGDKSKELQEVSRRKEADDNFLYCPSTSDDANSLLAHFQKHWRKGHPVKIHNVLQCASALSWDPVAIFCGYLEKGFSNCKKTEEAGEDVSCSDSYDIEVGTKKSFCGSAHGGYMQIRRETLKLKAKISTDFSQKLLGGNYTDIIHALPLQEYTNPRIGLLNIAVKLPDDFSDSKLGPHICISCGSREEVAWGELVTKLCCNSYDEVSILVHVGDAAFSTEQLNKMKKLIKRNNNMKDQGQISDKNIEDDEAKLDSEISVEAGDRLVVAGASCCSGATMDASVVNNRRDKSSPAKQVNGSDTDSDASMICSRASHSPDKAVDQLPPRDNLGSLNVNEKHPPLELCGAQWDVFRRQDIPKLVEYISKHVEELSLGNTLSNNVVHPIFDGIFYLDTVHKMQLKEEFDIEPWTFNQCLGEAVVIPAGCPYQIRNFKSCVNITEGFISPENASECIKLMNEIRVLPNNHKAKQVKLEVEKMTICTVDEAIKEIYRLMIEEGSW